MKRTTKPPSKATITTTTGDSDSKPSRTTVNSSYTLSEEERAERRRKKKEWKKTKQSRIVSIREARERSTEGQGPKFDWPWRRGRQPLLNDDMANKICADIRRGCYRHVAARANGISLGTLELWCRHGRDAAEKVEQNLDISKREELYLLFLRQVEHAEGEARKKAEIRVADEDPKFWLRVGPGRDKGPREPGWTDQVAYVGADGGPIAITIEDLVKRAATADE